MLAGERRAVVGVLDRRFDAEQFDQRPDVWVPFQIDPVAPDRGPLCFVSARLGRGIGLSAANAKLQIAAEAWRSGSSGPPSPNAGFAAVPLRDAMVGGVRGAIVMLASTTINGSHGPSPGWKIESPL